jgi:hypothetical protein
MEIITFNLKELHKHGSAFFEFLVLRKQFFVDQLGWDFPHDDDVKMNQYDNPKAYYSLAIQNGKVVGGMSYCQIWCLSIVGHAAIWSGFVVSIPSLNETPVMTFAR